MLGILISHDFNDGVEYNVGRKRESTIKKGHTHELLWGKGNEAKDWANDNFR